MDKKEIPLLDNFYLDMPILTAEKFVKTEIKEKYFDKVTSYKVTTVVLCWEYRETRLEHILKDCELIIDDVAWKSFLWKKKVLFVMLRIGAPTASACIEELKIYGIKNFIAAGTAGYINKNIDEKTTVVITRAIRDEGTSYHYLPPSLYVDLDKELADLLSDYLTLNGVKNIQGTTWTTDAFYRETKNRTAKRIKQGASGVEMEAAALAATAKFHNLKFGQFVWFTDKADGADWRFIADSEHRASTKEKMLLLALNFANELIKCKKNLEV